MAEDLSGDVRPSSRVAAAPLSEASPLLAQPRSFEEPRVFRARFVLAYLLLATIAGVGLGAAYLLAVRPDSAPGAPWSSWKPNGRESSYPRQIADYVSRRYLLASGAPMAFVLVDRPQVQQVPIRNVVINNDPADPSDLSVIGIDSRKSVMYSLCGTGGDCTLAAQTTSERIQLLHREAAELALFTFKYADIDTVIARMPPIPSQTTTGQPTQTGLFFRRKDFSRELSRPLAKTLIVSDLPTPDLVAIEGPTIDRLTRANVYKVEVTLAQEGSAVMLLTPFL